jgi:hypothetical protein
MDTIDGNKNNNKNNNEPRKRCVGSLCVCFFVSLLPVAATSVLTASCLTFDQSTCYDVINATILRQEWRDASAGWVMFLDLTVTQCRNKIPVVAMNTATKDTYPVGLHLRVYKWQGILGTCWLPNDETFTKFTKFNFAFFFLWVTSGIAVTFLVFLALECIHMYRAVPLTRTNTMELQSVALLTSVQTIDEID